MSLWIQVWRNLIKPSDCPMVNFWYLFQYEDISWQLALESVPSQILLLSTQISALKIKVVLYYNSYLLANSLKLNWRLVLWHKQFTKLYLRSKLWKSQTSPHFDAFNSWYFFYHKNSNVSTLNYFKGILDDLRCFLILLCRIALRSTCHVLDKCVINQLIKKRKLLNMLKLNSENIKYSYEVLWIFASRRTFVHWSLLSFPSDSFVTARRNCFLISSFLFSSFFLLFMRNQLIFVPQECFSIPSSHHISLFSKAAVKMLHSGHEFWN